MSSPLAFTVRLGMIALMLALAPAASAADNGKPKTKPNPAYAAAKKQITVCEKQVKAASVQLKTITAKYSDALARSQEADLASAQLLKQLREKAEQAPDLVVAQKRHEELNAQLDQIRRKAIDSLKDSVGYQQALEAGKQAAAKVQQLKNRPQGTVKAQDMQRAADAVLEAGAAIEKIVSDQVAADPKSTELQAQIKETQHQLIQLRGESEQAIRKDKDWLKMARQVNNADDFLTDVRNQLQQATQDMRSATDQLTAAQTTLARTPQVIYPATEPAKKK